MNPFKCEMERACNLCSVLMSQKKTFFTDNILVERQPPNDLQQSLPWYVGYYTTRTNDIKLETAKEILVTEDGVMVEKRRFERIHDMVECESYMKNEDIAENKDIFIYGFKHF